TALSAQSFSRTAVAARDIVVEAHLRNGPSQRTTIPQGSVLQDQQFIQVGGYPYARFRAVLPAPGVSRFEGAAGAQSLDSATFQGDVRVTLQSPAPTAVDLQLAFLFPYLTPGGLGFVDVHDDGTWELNPITTPLTVNTSAVFGPAPLPIRMN